MRAVHVAGDIADYIVALTQATRETPLTMSGTLVGGRTSELNVTSAKIRNRLQIGRPRIAP